MSIPRRRIMAICTQPATLARIRFPLHIRLRADLQEFTEVESGLDALRSLAATPKEIGLLVISPNLADATGQTEWLETVLPVFQAAAPATPVLAWDEHRLWRMPASKAPLSRCDYYPALFELAASLYRSNISKQPSSNHAAQTA